MNRSGWAFMPAAFAAAALLLSTAAPTGAAPGINTDPDDVSLKLDLKTVSHANDGATVTFVAETHDNFADRQTDFKWGIDTDGDEGFDLIVFAEWAQSELVAGVDDGAENAVAVATVTRPSPNSVRVVIPAGALGGASAYRYGVAAEEDRNANGESDPGEQDLAPDAGLYDHDPGPVPAAPALPGSSGAAPEPATAPAPDPASEPAPAPAAAPDGGIDTQRMPAGARPDPAPGPAPVPAARPAPVAAGSVTHPSEGGEVSPAASPAVEVLPSALARTGSPAQVPALLAGLALVAAGFMFFAETLLPKAKPRA